MCVLVNWTRATIYRFLGTFSCPENVAHFLARMESRSKLKRRIICNEEAPVLDISRKTTRFTTGEILLGLPDRLFLP